METGDITRYIDVAQVVLYAFWVFFAGLIYYLRTEDKREGYPLESDRSHLVTVQGFPPMPGPKRFLMSSGETVTVSNGRPDEREVRALPIGPWPGAPLEPTGDPMLDGVGPASYALRADVPDMTFEGLVKIVPLRVAGDFHLDPRDPDPRGMDVVGGDGKVAGTVHDAWVDRSEFLIRYLEVSVHGTSTPRRVLVPMNFVRVDSYRRQVKVRSILAHHFAQVPGLRNPDQVTLLEEERVMAYYGGGTLYATPERMGPFL